MQWPESVASIFVLENQINDLHILLSPSRSLIHPLSPSSHHAEYEQDGLFVKNTTFTAANLFKQPSLAYIQS